MSSPKIVVQKYGGSSVADVARLNGVADRVAATKTQGLDVVVVVSAMGNGTDELISLAHQVSKDPDRRELDMLISVGERTTMALLAMALKDRGVHAISLTGSQSGIITDEAHADAKIVEVRPARVRKCLEEGAVVIVAGFQGVSREREVTTLGRGGSDTTAVVLAAALGAEYCEICSDVDGVLSADPKVVNDAEVITEMSLAEGLALSRGGAKVLFEDAVRYARDAGVCIQAVSTFGPGAGTRLSVKGRELGAGPIGVTGDSALSRIKITADTMGELTGELVDSGCRICHWAWPFCYVDTTNVHRNLTEIPALENGEEVGLLRLVGTGLGEQPEQICIADTALRENGVVPGRMGARGDVIWWEIPQDKVDEGVQILHEHVIRAPLNE